MFKTMYGTSKMERSFFPVFVTLEAEGSFKEAKRGWGDSGHKTTSSHSTFNYFSPQKL